MLDYNILIAILVAVGLIVLIRVVLPYLKANGMQSNIYADIKLGLLMFGYAFRDDKIKDITKTIYDIVSTIEVLDLAAAAKKDEALRLAFVTLMDELNIVLDDEALSTIINIAVSYLPPTNLIE